MMNIQAKPQTKLKARVGTVICVFIVDVLDGVILSYLFHRLCDF